MKAFEFRLEAVLKLKERKKKVAEVRQRLARQALAGVEREIARLHDELNRGAERFAQALGRLGTLEAYSMQATSLGRALATAEHQAQKARLELARADEQLRQAAQAVEALQQLKDQRWHEYRTERAAEQQERVEEFVLRQWLRRGAEPLDR
jgi:flagellar biosynthesis chaperone FliJ